MIHPDVNPLCLANCPELTKLRDARSGVAIAHEVSVPYRTAKDTAALEAALERSVDNNCPGPTDTIVTKRSGLLLMGVETQIAFECPVNRLHKEPRPQISEEQLAREIVNAGLLGDREHAVTFPFGVVSTALPDTSQTGGKPFLERAREIFHR